MNTEYLTITGDPAHDEAVLWEAAEVIRRGGLAAIPTETVYGLAGRALLEDSAAKIYAAKGRPADNPLIVHVSKPEEAERIAFTNPLFYRLAGRFMPGPLTVILNKRDVIPDTVTAGGSTVAVRCPSHPIARRLIELSGHPLAAPSANRSGSPSPTTAEHVKKDLDGLIDLIVDAGPCSIGLESTVIRLDGEDCTVLRPGAVTPAMLEEIVPHARVSGAVVQPALANGVKPESPGMKYKHYAPKAELILVDAPREWFVALVRQNAGKGIGAMVPDSLSACFPNVTILPTGPDGDWKEWSRRFFSLLREADDAGLTRIYAELPPPEGESLALYNRIIRSAGCRVLTEDGFKTI